MLDHSKQPEYIWDYFPGGVPPAQLFRLDLLSLQETMRQYEDEEDAALHMLARTPDLCFMAVVGYFEAFCKNHFASILNICPNLVARLKGHHPTSIDATDLLQFGAFEQYKLGFLLSEHYDFGTAQKVNAIYHHLLRLTPFSKAHKERYDDILRDRNLLVHHGGIYTPTYLRQTPVELPADQAVFFHSLQISMNVFQEISGFLEAVTRATARTTQLRLREESDADQITLTEFGRKAVDIMFEAEDAPIYAQSEGHE